VVFDLQEAAGKLVEQISHTVNWAACLEACLAAGAKTVLELGPGRALANMAREVLKDAQVRSVEDFVRGMACWHGSNGPEFRSTHHRQGWGHRLALKAAAFGRSRIRLGILRREVSRAVHRRDNDAWRRLLPILAPVESANVLELG
jgi:hypothetical protein